MDSAILYERLQMLPDTLKKEASDFIDFLLQKVAKEDMIKVGKPVFGSAKGKVHMADDFDEPLEDFKENM